MGARNQSSTVLLVLVFLITFPIWMTIGGIFFGVVVGLFGAAIGVVAALAGGLIALLAFPFKWVFGGDRWGLYDGIGFHHFHVRTYLTIALIIIAVLIARRNRTAS